MKIMKVLGVVVGIHVFALILIFANPGCSSTSKPAPAPVDTLAKTEPAPAVSVPGVGPSVNVAMNDSASSPVTAAPVAFNPDAPALASSGGVRFSPTRPGTPAASTLVAEPVADVVPATTYVVKPGDSLWTIAKKNHLTYQELASANNLKPNAALHEGQKLLIPSKVVPATKSTSAPAATKSGESAPSAKSPGESVKHVVKSGESLSTIAKKYGVRQGDIAVANNITDPQKIYLGMELIIPGWQNPAGKPVQKTGAASAPKSSAPAKASPPEIKPIFNAPAATPDASGRAPASGAVPVIKVDDTPAPAGKP
jgi:LysM repeat protein